MTEEQRAQKAAEWLHKNTKFKVSPSPNPRPFQIHTTDYVNEPFQTRLVSPYELIMFAKSKGFEK